MGCLVLVYQGKRESAAGNTNTSTVHECVCVNQRGCTVGRVFGGGAFFRRRSLTKVSQLLLNDSECVTKELNNLLSSMQKLKMKVVLLNFFI
jgi:hypothetical protein